MLLVFAVKNEVLYNDQGNFILCASIGDCVTEGNEGTEGDMLFVYFEPTRTSE